MTAGDRARVRRIADGIVLAHASYRRRVRWAVVAGAAVAIVVALPSLLLLDRPRESVSAAGAGGSRPVPAIASRDELPVTARTVRPEVLESNGAGASDYPAALRRWRPHGVIRVYRASTTPELRAELRAEFGSRVHFVDTTKRAAVLYASGMISLPRASSTRGSSS